MFVLQVSFSTISARLSPSQQLQVLASHPGASSQQEYLTTLAGVLPRNSLADCLYIRLHEVWSTAFDLAVSRDYPDSVVSQDELPPAYLSVLSMGSTEIHRILVAYLDKLPRDLAVQLVTLCSADSSANFSTVRASVLHPTAVAGEDQ